MKSRSELKAELMRESEVLVDELLDWNNETPRPNLTQIEEVVLKLRKRLGEKMALVVIESQEATRGVPGPRCPGCQREMHYKGRKGNQVESQVGRVSLERGYYYCEACKVGLFPPG